MSTPATLPANFDKWDDPKGSTPPATLPADFAEWDSSTPPAIATSPADAKRKLSYGNLTAPIDPGLDQYSKEHPVLGGIARTFGTIGGTVMGLPGSIYGAFAEPATPEEEAAAGEKITGAKRIGLGIGRLTGAQQIKEAGQFYAPAFGGTEEEKAKLNKQDIKGVIPEAIGTGVGTYAGGEIGGKALGKGLSTVGKLREKVQPFARKVTGIEPAVKTEVTKASEKYGEALQGVEEQKQHQAERGAQARTVDEQSVKVKKHLEKVENAVHEEGNRRFEAVREKVGNPQASPEQVQGLVGSVKNAETEILHGVPEHIKEFRSILGHEELPENIKGAAEKFASSKGFELEGPDPVTWDYLQSIKSRIDARLRSRSPMNGDVQMALQSVRENTIGLMGQMAEAAGATDLWKSAKDWWAGYKQNFVVDTGKGGSASPIARSLNAVDPANIRQPFLGPAESTLGNRGADLLRKYPQHGGLEAADAVEGLVKGHKELKYLGPEKNPNPPAPKPPTVDVSNVAKNELQRWATNVGKFNARDIGIIVSAGIAEPIANLLGLGGRGGSLLPVAVGAYEGGKFVVSRVANSPKVVEWLAKTPPAEVEVLSRIQGADKIKIVDGLTDIAVQAKAKNLSPAARSLLGPANVARIMAASGATQVNNRKDALDLLGQPPSQP